MRDRAVLQTGFVRRQARSPEEKAANRAANQTLFEQLSPIALTAGGHLVACWAADASPDAPVLLLIHDGEFVWLGTNLAEALGMLAGFENQQVSARPWFAQRRLSTGTGDPRAKTQFLPSLESAFQALYAALRGKPKTELKQAPAIAIADNPLTWLARPGDEVRDVATERLGKAPEHRFVTTDGPGLITNIHLDAQLPAAIWGVGIGSSKADMHARLGPPDELLAFLSMHRYNRDGATVSFTLDDAEVVTSIDLKAE